MNRRGVLAFVSVLALNACHGAPLAEAVMPNQGHDASQLARCSVAASHDQPLVTEWPAPYKARLEALLGEGAVAVEYSGCELRIVDGCRVPGSYTWKRTTLSRDTTDIQDEDELYTKLPLGAITLSGQLKMSGSLHVETTVAGQMQLVGKALQDSTTGAECARATHLVTALSVGAFKLVSGGNVATNAGVEVAGMGGKGGTAQGKSVLRSAGDPSTCEHSTKEAPDEACKSPIQIFLSPIRRSVPLNTLSPVPDEKG